MRWGRTIAIVGGGIVLLWLIAAPPYCTPFNQAVMLPDSSGPGLEVPDIGGRRQYAAPDFRVSTFDHGRFHLRAHRGTPVVLNFWESW